MGDKCPTCGRRFSPASEDWIATLNELIVSARAVVGKAEGKVMP